MNEQWKLVPVEPTEVMVICGFESEPNECFSEEEDWAAYQEMSGCQQAAHKAKLCYAAMLAAAPQPPSVGDEVETLSRSGPGGCIELVDRQHVTARDQQLAELKEAFSESQEEVVSRGKQLAAQAKENAELRARVAELENALNQLSGWPDGGQRYGQDNMKKFAAKALAQQDGTP